MPVVDAVRKAVGAREVGAGGRAQRAVFRHRDAVSVADEFREFVGGAAHLVPPRACEKRGRHVRGRDRDRVPFDDGGVGVLQHRAVDEVAVRLAAHIPAPDHAAHDSGVHGDARAFFDDRVVNADFVPGDDVRRGVGVGGEARLVRAEDVPDLDEARLDERAVPEELFRPVDKRPRDHRGMVVGIGNVALHLGREVERLCFGTRVHVDGVPRNLARFGLPGREPPDEGAGERAEVRGRVDHDGPVGVGGRHPGPPVGAVVAGGAVGVHPGVRHVEPRDGAVVVLADRRVGAVGELEPGGRGGRAPGARRAGEGEGEGGERGGFEGVGLAGLMSLGGHASGLTWVAWSEPPGAWTPRADRRRPGSAGRKPKEGRGSAGLGAWGGAWVRSYVASAGRAVINFPYTDGSEAERVSSKA